MVIETFDLPEKYTDGEVLILNIEGLDKISPLNIANYVQQKVRKSTLVVPGLIPDYNAYPYKVYYNEVRESRSSHVGVITPNIGHKNQRRILNGLIPDLLLKYQENSQRYDSGRLVVSLFLPSPAIVYWGDLFIAQIVQKRFMPERLSIAEGVNPKKKFLDSIYKQRNFTPIPGSQSSYSYTGLPLELGDLEGYSSQLIRSITYSNFKG